MFKRQGAWRTSMMSNLMELEKSLQEEPSIGVARGAEDVRRGVMRLLMQTGDMPICELILPNGRRADVAALARDGTVLIVEIKSSVADFRSDQKWPDYRAYCDRLFFAVSPEFPNELLPPECGLILADRYGGEIVRDAPVHARLTAARRKALTLQIARVAAARLAAQLDPRLSELFNDTAE